jgi:hypothetical protein
MRVIEEHFIDTKDELLELDLAQGAEDTIEELTDSEVETILSMVEEMEEDITDSYLSDFFWFERDTIAEWLGYDSFEDIMNREDEE